VLSFCKYFSFLPIFEINSSFDRSGINFLSHIGKLWNFLLGRPDIAFGKRLSLSGLQLSCLYHTTFDFRDEIPINLDQY